MDLSWQNRWKRVEEDTIKKTVCEKSFKMSKLENLFVKEITRPLVLVYHTEGMMK